MKLKKLLNLKKQGLKSRSEVDDSNLTEIEKLKLELEKEKSLRKREDFDSKSLKEEEF